MELGLEGKVAFVTGAGQGVGRRISLDLAAEGACLAVNDLVAERAEAVASEIRAAGGKAIAAAGDITDYAQVEAATAKAASAFGPVQILVNNAGVLKERRDAGGIPPKFLESDPAEWRKIVDLNTFGTLNCCKAVMPGMVDRKYGKVVCIISEAGRIGEARLAVYSGAKASLAGFAKAIAREYGPDGINVNLVALGATSHEGIKAGALAPDATVENNSRLPKMLKMYPIGMGLGRIGRPEDVSATVALLCSDRTAFVTGQTIGVSGGYAMI